MSNGSEPCKSQACADHKAAAVKDDPLLVLYLCLDITDCIRWVYLKGDGLAVEHLHANLRAEVEVLGSVVLDLIVVSKCSIILELVASQEEALVATNLSPDMSDRVSDGSTWSAMVLLVRVCT